MSPAVRAAFFFDNTGGGTYPGQSGAITIQTLNNYVVFIFPSNETAYSLTSVSLPVKGTAAGTGFTAALYAWDAVAGGTTGAAIGAGGSYSCAAACTIIGWQTATLAGALIPSICNGAAAFYALRVKMGATFSYYALTVAASCADGNVFPAFCPPSLQPIADVRKGTTGATGSWTAASAMPLSATKIGVSIVGAPAASSCSPSFTPSMSPTTGGAPATVSDTPSGTPTAGAPSASGSGTPTAGAPSASGSGTPSGAPTASPSRTPTLAPSAAPCGAGTFGAAPACAPCAEGHYCPPGTLSWARLSCGRGNFCPEGASAPTPCPIQVPPPGSWGALQVQGPAFLVETARCANHCFWNFSSGDYGALSKC